MTGPTDFEEMYRAFEDRFRGSEELIRGRLSLYLPLIELIATNTGEARKALDIGCGRGEWLTLLKENGWHAVGVDSIHAASTSWSPTPSPIWPIARTLRFRW